MQFANAIGVPLKTVQNWDQGVGRYWNGTTLVLLSLLDKDPFIVLRTLGRAPRGGDASTPAPASPSR